MRNYDTMTHKPYPRVTEVSIKYATDGTPSITYLERDAVVDGDGKVQHLDSGAQWRTLDLSAITEPVQVVHPDTGADMTGMTATQQQVMLGLLAFLRADQKRVDALSDPQVAQAPPEDAGP